MNLAEKGAALAALAVEGNRITAEQAVEIAHIVGDAESFFYFDALAGGGSRMADEYGCWKVRQARNMNIDGKSPFFDTLKALAS
jgi:hypothetical protein